jgi:hypothetical protein
MAQPWFSLRQFHHVFGDTPASFSEQSMARQLGLKECGDIFGDNVIAAASGIGDPDASEQQSANR